MDLKVVSKYCGRKVNVCRWYHSSNSSSHGGGDASSRTLITGSWDEGSRNCITMWSMPSSDSGRKSAWELEDDVGSEDPVEVASFLHEGDVTGLEYLDSCRVITSSSTGAVSVYRVPDTVHPDTAAIHDCGLVSQQVFHGKEGTSSFPSTCIAVPMASSGAAGLAASGGEDGLVNVFGIEDKAPTWTAEVIGSINAAKFISSTQLVTVSSSIQIHIWDVRQSGRIDAPSSLLKDDLSPSVTLLSVASHANQPMYIATGGQDGAVTLWDIRSPSAPLQKLIAHTDGVSEVRFHDIEPNNLFSCSIDGTVMHWEDFHITSKRGVSEDTLAITSLMPGNLLSVNSLDVFGSQLVCGTDTQALFFAQLPSLR